ncbi:hypothetical protein PsorP6_008768 [Peronosclerospora sorghi]|uniref:Uncharacterized protein n=1 Tax=Peronosclerospora sorghi TaxID=230839 RepID=A0ACC0VXC8_9STRA|nr:hypothetical protein PsorP6_008768 [Peronosclerospora sorghi]
MMALLGALMVTMACSLALAQRLHPSIQYHEMVQKQEKLPIERDLSIEIQSDEQTLKEDGDLVKNLPGLDPSTTVVQHAGRIALHDNDNNLIFYWHFQSSQDVEKTPLVIWLNGGPGCSSMQGVFLGNSPFKLLNELKVGKNEHNQPVGTGMSSTRGNDYRSNEHAVAVDFYEFLIKFLQRHTEYLSDGDDGMKYSRAVYMFGESHAGRWIPEFSEYILEQNEDPSIKTKIRLEGVGIGNGWVHPKIQYEYSDYAHGIGLLTFGQVLSLKASYDECLAALNSGTFRSQSCFANMNAITRSVKSGAEGNNLNFYDVRQYVPSVGAYPPGQENIVKYMNNMKVRKALHGNENTNFRFSICSDDVYRGLANFDGVSTLEIFQLLLQKGLRVIFYNGQWDMMCNHYGTEKLLLSLNWQGSEAFQQATKYTWRVQGRKEPAGFAQQGGNLTYVVVAGAGHMVTLDVPDVAADLLRRFVNGLGFNDKAQSVRNARLNSSDLETRFCFTPSNDSSAGTKYSAFDQSGGTYMSTWGVAITALGSIAVTVCLTLFCLRRRRNRQPVHEAITQVCDDEHLDQFDDNDEEKSSNEENFGKQMSQRATSPRSPKEKVLN